MTKLYITLLACALMLPIIPFSKYVAAGTTSPLFTHFVFMFGHASVLHWLCNTWGLLMLHNLFKWRRLITAWGLSVILSFVFIPDKPVLGASVFVAFFMGLIAVQQFRRDKTAAILTLLILVISCFLPGFAGSYHIILYLAGMLSFYIERVFKNFADYAKG